MIHLLVSLLLFLPQQNSCQQDDRCGTGMCLTWENGRHVCEPNQYTVVVWDRACLDKVELSDDSKLEAPTYYDGSPNIKEATLTHVKVTFTKNCTSRLEVRKR